MHFYLTNHAIEQFHFRHRPYLRGKEAEEELKSLTASARLARNRALVGGALLYIAVSEGGEHIRLAVRDATVVTVLPDDAERLIRTDLTPSAEELEESKADVEACRMLLAKEASATIKLDGALGRGAWPRREVTLEDVGVVLQRLLVAGPLNIANVPARLRDELGTFDHGQWGCKKLSEFFDQFATQLGVEVRATPKGGLELRKRLGH
jgi:hypothetical protein